mmetsp:Transcript_789/g.832  ORF Transcript_789/g.832 Transcript_789/m.832 type:complete len:120 (-) Transcript_789:464-823(-)
MKISTAITFTAATAILNGICVHASSATDAASASRTTFSFDDALIIGNFSETVVMKDNSNLIGNDADMDLPWSRDILGVRSVLILLLLSSYPSNSILILVNFVSQKPFLTLFDANFFCRT